MRVVLIRCKLGHTANHVRKLLSSLEEKQQEVTIRWWVATMLADMFGWMKRKQRMEEIL